MRIMIDCDKLMERKDLRKEVKRKKGMREKRQEGKKSRGVKLFS